MFCTNCGAQMEQDAGFCAKCGTARDLTNAPPNEKPQSEIPLNETPHLSGHVHQTQSERPVMQSQCPYPQYGQQMPYSQPSPYGQPLPDNRKSKLWIPFAAGSVVLVGVIVVLSVLIFNSLSDEAKVPETEYIAVIEEISDLAQDFDEDIIEEDVDDAEDIGETDEDIIDEDIFDDVEDIIEEDDAEPFDYKFDCDELAVEAFQGIIWEMDRNGGTLPIDRLIEAFGDIYDSDPDVGFLGASFIVFAPHEHLHIRAHHDFANEDYIRAMDLSHVPPAMCMGEFVICELTLIKYVQDLDSLTLSRLEALIGEPGILYLYGWDVFGYRWSNLDRVLVSVTVCHDGEVHSIFITGREILDMRFVEW